MASYCIVKPQVRVNGELQDSRLFGNIKAYTFGDYTSSKTIYLSAIHDVVDSYNGKKQLEFNSQGELELSELLDNFDIRPFLPKNFNQKLQNQFGLAEQEYTAQNYTELLQRCENLNNSIYGNNYFATLEITDDQIKPVIKWKATKNAFNEERKAQIKSAQLSSKLMLLLSKWGIGVDTLYDAEERMSNGKTDLTSVEKAADGLYHIIRIAKGDRGIASLPEELGHVVVSALIDNPIMQRTINVIKNKGLAEVILGDKYDWYYDKYQGDEEYLAEEAAGKLMALHFLQNLEIEDDIVYKQLLGRTVNNAKNFFSKLNETELSNAILEVNESLSLITKELINNDESLNLSSRSLQRIYYQANNTQERINRLRDPIVKILNTENKRYKIYIHNTKIRKETAELLKQLKEKIRNNDYKDAILLFLNDTMDKVKDLSSDLNNLNKSQNLDLKTKASKLRHYRSIIFSYTKLLQYLYEDVNTEMKFDDSAFDESVKELITKELSIVGNCLSEYNFHAKRVVKEYISPILGNNMIVDKGWLKKDRVEYTVDQVLNMDLNDISWFDMMLDSASDSRSYLVKGVDAAIKQQKGLARQEAIDFYKKVSARTKQLERDGYKNQDWAFERDSNGSRTGYYITQFNRGEFEKARRKFMNSLLEKYPESSRNSPDVRRAVNQEMEAWEKANPITNFPNPEYHKLSQTQKEYIKDILQYKLELDNLLPTGVTDTLRTIKIRKDLLERVKSSHSIQDALHSFSESIKESFVRNSTETEYGVKTVLQDFEGFEYRNLPVFYIHRGKDTSEEDISTDIVSTMTAYAAMAYENYEMSDIIDVLETLHSLARDAENPYNTSGGRRLVEVFSNDTQAYQRAEHNRIVDRLNYLFDMQVYHKTLKDEGTVGSTNLDKSKLTSRAMGWSQKTAMAFNTLANISNVLTGNIQFKTQAFGGQFFSYADAIAADGIYTKHLAEFIADIGSRTKSSWLWTVSELFNVMQDYEQELGDKKFDRKWYERLSIGGLSMLLQNAGEFWMQHRTFFALMHSEKEMLKDADGNAVRAIDAFEVKPINDNNPEDGSKLVFKKGLIVQNGKYKGKKIITKEELEARAAKDENNPAWTSKSLLKEDEISQTDYVNYMSRKSAKLNQDMHGIYNEEDKAAMYSHSLGRLAGQYRKWIKPSLNRRFRATIYDYDLDAVVEGTYRTLGRILAQDLKAIYKKEFDTIVRWKDLNDYEKSNLRQVFAEIGAFLLILLCIGLLPDDDEPEKDKSYFARMYKYQLYRLRNEIGVLIPGPYMVREGVKLVQSPMASVSLAEKVSNAFALFTPWNWREIQSGRYKGWYKPFNTIADLVPYNRSIYRTFHPEQGTPFYM